MSSLRPRIIRRSRRYSPWDHDKRKQEIRDRLAEVIAQHFGAHPEPLIFVMPHYEASCAKTINQRVPKAKFFGTEYYRVVFEKIAALDQGKTIEMQRETVVNYIRHNAGTLCFDAAFLDYKAKYAEKIGEVQDFAQKMLMPKAVLAVTTQRGDLLNGAETVLNDLRKVLAQTKLEDYFEYTTPTPMITGIFLIDTGAHND